jgi:hypothetical protein
LDDRYEILKDEWIEARGSLYGKYKGDRVMASRTTLAVATSPHYFTPNGRRRFFWRCHAIREFAMLQMMVLYELSARLAKVGTSSGPDEDGTRRLIAIAEHLVEFPRGLPAHHRKWFYECQQLLGGAAAIDDFYGVIAEVHKDAQHAAIMRRMSETRNVRITLNQSQVGTLNLGTIIGDVETHLSEVTAPGAEEVRAALQQLAQGVLEERGLDEHTRRELLESVDALAEEAAKSPEKRRRGIIRPVLTGLTTSLPAAGGLATVWATVGPVLIHFFGG